MDFYALEWQKSCSLTRFTQEAGQAAFFLPGEIHMTGSAGNEGSKIIRLEAQKLDGVPRHFYGQKGETATLVIG